MQVWAQGAYGKPVASCNGRVMLDSDQYICVNCEWYWIIGDARHYKIIEEFQEMRVHRTRSKRKGPLLDKEGNPRTGRPAESAWSQFDDFNLEELEEWNPTSA